MKTTFQSLVVLIFTVTSVFGGDVEKIISNASKDIPDKEVLAAEVKKLETRLPRPQLVKELIFELMGASSPVTEAVVNRMILGIEPFPFQEIRDQLTPESSSTKRAYLLFLLNKGAFSNTQMDEVLELAKSFLGNKGKGIRRYGEARAYSADGLRVCDVAYNILVTRLSLAPSMPPVDVDNFLTDKRDLLILELAKRESIQLKTDDRSDRHATPDEKENSRTVSKHSPFEKALEVEPSAQNEKPISSKLWPVMMIVAVIGLLWLLMKKRF
jgi:hypothetical protein